MNDDTNNQLLHDIAGVDRTALKTNNQLLRVIADNIGGEGQTATWGDIGGNIDNQPDLKNALDAKAGLDEVVLVGGQNTTETLVLGTNSDNDVQIFSRGEPRILISAGGNIGIASEPEMVPLMVGGGIWTKAGAVRGAMNPYPGTDLKIGSTTNHPLNLQVNNNTILSLNTDGSVSSSGPLTVSTSATVPVTTIDTSGGGAGVVSISDNGAAMTSGARVGYKLFGGATDAASTIYHSAGIEAHATEAWTPSAGGSSLSFEVTANGTLSRVTALEIGNDGTIDVKSNKITNVPVPDLGPDVANKNYVDAQITIVNQDKLDLAAGNSLVYVTSPTGTQTTVTYAPSAATPNTMVQRAADGTITTNPPSAELHAANRGYVDARTLTEAAVTAVGALSTISTADATDPATTMALVNECKAKINSVIDALKAT